MKPLVFNMDISQYKPETIRNKDGYCPFCHPDELVNILEQDGHIIWLMNKYPVVEKTWPTVIIETNQCMGEFSTLDFEEALHIMDFSISRWQQVVKNGRFASVVFLKNFGPLSGGSIRHPHSQIIGFEDYDYKKTIKRKHFVGHKIAKEDGIEINLSSHPLIGFFEFNLILSPGFLLKTFTANVRGILQYILKAYSKRTESYNIYFYDLADDNIYVKVIPRFIASPLFIGYKMSQVANPERVEAVINTVRTYLHKE